MMNIRIDERHAYVEVEVFGQYEPDRMNEIIEAMRGLAQRHDYFSELEIHHGKPGKIFSAMAKASSMATEANFMTKMHKYALVSDNVGFVLRGLLALSNMGKLKTRIFPMHERDQARQWLEEPYAPLPPPTS